MADGVAVYRDGRRTWLKWHRARKVAGDLPFTDSRILEGMRLGASVEVDLVRHADHGFAVLHDFSLDHDTTGRGLAADTPGPVLRGLFLTDAEGRATTYHPMLLEDLCALLASGQDVSPDAVLQLDLKEDDPAMMGAAEVTAFATAVAPVARHFILSGGSAATVGMLAGAVPGLLTGYDPCHEHVVAALEASRDFAGFVAEALRAAPEAKMIYLDHRLVLWAADLGFDLVAAFHAAGRTVDAYTLNETNPITVAQAERLLALEVDQITTDDPAGLELALGG